MQALKPSAIREILKVTETPEIISFAGGLPAPELFPVAAIAQAAAECLADDGPAALQYGPSEGYTPLREWIAGHVQRTVGIPAKVEQVLITHGSQQGLDLIAKVMINPGDTIIVENPAYLGALQAFQAYEPRIVGLPSDDEGMLPEALGAFLQFQDPKPKFIYLVTNFQNPTGRSTSGERRRTLARIAGQAGVLVVEDDPYGALRYSGSAHPALGAEPDSGPSVYLGTTSKILAPGMRVAWAVTTHAALFHRLLTAKQASDLHTSSFTQRIVWRVLRTPGLLESHLVILNGVYRSRRDVMLRALEAHMPAGTEWTRPDGGLFLWVNAPGGVDTLELLKRSIERQVAFVPGSPFWVGDAVTDTLRLNFSNASAERIDDGVQRLGAVLKTMLGRRS
jgi:2-aminoadipate transaminase